MGLDLQAPSGCSRSSPSLAVLGHGSLFLRWQAGVWKAWISCSRFNGQIGRFGEMDANHQVAEKKLGGETFATRELVIHFEKVRRE